MEETSAYPLQLLVRQANTVLYSNFIANPAILTEDCDTLDFDAILHNTGGVTTDGSWGTFDTRPSADTAAPTNDGVEDTCVVLDLDVLEDNRLLDTDTWTNDYTRPD